MYEIDASERAWFISYEGKKLANGTSHKQLIKDSFSEDWELFVDELSQKNSKDKTDPLIEAEAEKTFTFRLLKTGWVKIGEIGENFYLDSNYSNEETKEIASYFARALIKVRDVGNNVFVINNIAVSSAYKIAATSRYTVQELADLNKEEDNSKQLCSGVFWVLSDNADLSDYEFLIFDIPCDANGKSNNTHSIELNSKSGNSYNHKKLWESEVKNDSKYRPYNKKEYDYYPRGRVEISNNRATVYLNPHINSPNFTDAIKEKFGLLPCNVFEVRVVTDGSEHYQCFLDK